MLMLHSCSTDELMSDNGGNAVPIESIEPSIALSNETRAYDPATDPEYVGRPVFVGNDKIKYTRIARTTSPLTAFTYTNIEYKMENDNAGNGQWKRSDGSGISKIYWSDAKSDHTFIGYSTPQQKENETFDWINKSIEGGVTYYYGSLGKPEDTADVLDYSGNSTDQSLKHDDIVLTYNTQMLAQSGGSIAKVLFYHGLANIKIVVDLNGFSTSSDVNSPDNKVKVSDMVVKNMPVFYKWTQQDAKLRPLNATGEPENIYGTVIPYNKTRDIKTWTHAPEGQGTNQNKKFTFHSLAVPTAEGTDGQTLNFEFQVTYPNPLTHEDEDHTYKASIEKVQLYAGKCTTITIKLNHANESMTVGAEYAEWDYVPTPDQSSLKKNSTFLSDLDKGTGGRKRVTIHTDNGTPECNNLNATVDDATWLYITKENQNIIKDIYGHEGNSIDDAYVITGADQLLSFAYEVKSGFNFTGKFIQLNADITMQSKEILNSYNSDNVETTSLIEWFGIGDASHPFNGVFLGSGRHINYLYGEHFFHTVGPDAVVDKLSFANVIELKGCGVVAHENKGLICGCNIEGNVEESDKTTTYTGSFVGINNSFVIACTHVGKVSGYGKVGGLVGFNNGTVMASYHSGVVEAKDASGTINKANAHPTVGEYGDGKKVINGKTSNNSIMFSCYYDSNVFKDNRDLVPGKLGYPLSTTMMQSPAFVSDGINSESFNFNDETGEYKGLGPILRTIAETIVYDKILEEEKKQGEVSDERIEEIKENIQNMSNDLLIINILPQDALSFEVFKVFEYHFSLNTAVRVFDYWIKRIHADTENKESVDTNCHTFTKAQIEFLNSHYTNEHRFNYTPASYPKVQ